MGGSNCSASRRLHCSPADFALVGGSRRAAPGQAREAARSLEWALGALNEWRSTESRSSKHENGIRLNPLLMVAEDDEGRIETPRRLEGVATQEDARAERRGLREIAVGIRQLGESL